MNDLASLLSLDSVPCHSPDVVASVVRGEAILVLSEQSKVKVLNELATRIWELADGQLSIRQIAARLCHEYEVDAVQAEQDTLAFVNEMFQRGLLYARGEDSGSG